MRAIALLIVTFFASAVFASGKLSLEPRYNPKNEQTTYTVGLSIYETLITDRAAFNSWTGFGDAMLEDDENSFSKWYVTKNSIDFFVGKAFTISPGVRLAYRPRDGEFSKDTVVQEVFGKVSLRLW